MTKTVEAIYEDGVLKPVEPLELPDHQRVELTVRVMAKEQATANGGALDPWPEMEVTPEGRQAALDRFFAAVDEMNLHLPHPLPTRDELHERR